MFGLFARSFITKLAIVLVSMNSRSLSFDLPQLGLQLFFAAMVLSLTMISIPMEAPAALAQIAAPQAHAQSAPGQVPLAAAAGFVAIGVFDATGTVAGVALETSSASIAFVADQIMEVNWAIAGVLSASVALTGF